MKSGPTLNGATFNPRLVRAAINPKAAVVLPQPLLVPAITSALMVVLLFLRLMSQIKVVILNRKDDIKYKMN
jgi:hypothetical protein